MRFWAFAVVFVLSTSCNLFKSADSKVKIINGEDSSAKEDYVVYVNGPRSRHCTGSLIEPNVVMTALHCVGKKIRPGTSACKSTLEHPDNDQDYAIMDAMFYEVRAERDVKSSAGRHKASAQVEDIFVGKNCLLGGDVAFLLLEKPLLEITSQNTLDISREQGRLGRVRWEKMPEKNEIVSVIGWGRLANNDLPLVRQVRRNVKILEVGSGWLKGSPGNDPEEEFVATEFLASEASCTGDSGGPVVDKEGRIIGVTSRGEGNCVGTNGIYTAVAAHKALFDLVLAASAKKK